MTPRDAAFRLAAWKAWNERCALCNLPLAFGDLEIDHLIPKRLTGSDLQRALEAHGLPPDYDLYSTDNLAPVHGHPCNCAKASKPLPRSPRIDLLRADASRLGPEIEREAARYRKAEKLVEAVAVVDAADPRDLTPSKRRELVRSVSLIVARLGIGTSVRVHRSVNPHDYEPPDVQDVGASFNLERFESLLTEWAKCGDLDDVVAETFDEDGGQQLRSARFRGLIRLGYAIDLDMFLARVQLDVNYTHYDSEGFGSEADVHWQTDLWFSLDESRDEVLDVQIDHMGSFLD